MKNYRIQMIIVFILSTFLIIPALAEASPRILFGGNSLRITGIKTANFLQKRKRGLANWVANKILSQKIELEEKVGHSIPFLYIGFKTIVLLPKSGTITAPNGQQIDFHSLTDRALAHRHSVRLNIVRIVDQAILLPSWNMFRSRKVIPSMINRQMGFKVSSSGISIILSIKVGRNRKEIKRIGNLFRGVCNGMYNVHTNDKGFLVVKGYKEYDYHNKPCLLKYIKNYTIKSLESQKKARKAKNPKLKNNKWYPFLALRSFNSHKEFESFLGGQKKAIQVHANYKKSRIEAFKLMKLRSDSIKKIILKVFSKEKGAEKKCKCHIAVNPSIAKNRREIWIKIFLYKNKAEYKKNPIPWIKKKKSI